MHIRKCTISDFEHVFGLLLQLWPDAKLNKSRLLHAFRRAIGSDHQQYLCAIYENKIVGLCTLSIRSSLWQQGYIAHIDEIVVDQAYRRQGIGTQLMTKAMSIASKTGCSRIELDTAFHRRHAHEFYKQLGYEKRAYVFSMTLDRS